jgi:REP element-mobilizing transposase RayT
MEMPRSSRIQSESAFYHVMLRGINQSQLFYDDEDRIAFLERVTRFKEECQFSLYAYSLMGNHVHLVIQEHETKLPTIIKKLALSYSHWFNAKYDRSGYLFQGRYKSEPIDSDEYLLAVVRYVHNNPVKVGSPITFWTSYGDYLQESSFVDTEQILSMFAIDCDEARSAFSEFSLASDDSAKFLDDEVDKRITDAEAIATILKISGLKTCIALGALEKDARNRILVDLRHKGLSVRQIARLTGINRNIVFKAS